MKDSRHLTPAEFEIIELLWRGPSIQSVRQVRSVLKQRRPVAYTTVMTLMDKMARKGSLRRVKKGKAYFYQAAVEEEAVRGFLLEDFSRAYWRGDMEAIARFLESDFNNHSDEPLFDRESPPRPSRSTGELDITLL